MPYPRHIPGTWQFSGDWLGSYRLIATDLDIGNPLAESRDILCPICEYPKAIHLTKEHRDYPLMYYCPECGTVWAWSIARCPDCDGFIWIASERHPFECAEGQVRCSMCDMDMDIDFVKEVNEDDDFHNEGYEGS